MRALPLILVLLLPACDLLSGDECSSDSDCSGDDVCDSGECVECESDSDCDDDEECDDGECERVNGGNEGEGEGEGEEGEGEEGEGEGEASLDGVGQACSVSGFNAPGSCESGLVCVPLTTGSFTGVCRVKCGDFEGAGPDAVTNAIPDGTSCFNGTSCQVITTLPDAAFAAVACVERGNQRDAPCSSVFDEFFNEQGFPNSACPAGLDCQLTATEANDATGEQEFQSFNCKEPCDLLGSNTCDAGEECLPRPINFPPDIELDPFDGTEIQCDDGLGAIDASCTSGDDVGCPCTLSDGFRCQEFGLAGGGTGFFCNRDGGNCGRAIPAFQVADEPNLGDAALLCNEVEDSRYCDPSIFDGAPEAEAGQNVCLGVSATSNDGICFAFCKTPEFDLNDDGDTFDTDDSPGESFACGTGFTCSPALGLLINVFVDLGRSCSASLCTDGEPCPAECGPGDAYCSTAGACVAPFFSCEPAPAEGEGEGEGEGEVP